MSVFQYAGAFSERLDARRYGRGMRFNGHEFLVQVDHRRMPTACGGWLRRWIHFGSRGAVWFRIYG